MPQARVRCPQALKLVHMMKGCLSARSPLLQLSVIATPLLLSCCCCLNSNFSHSCLLSPLAPYAYALHERNLWRGWRARRRARHGESLKSVGRCPEADQALSGLRALGGY